jgi:uncharacterized protein (DUF4213/DUF364 family)
MTLPNEYLELFTRIAEHVTFPAVEGIYLPTPREESEKKDEFAVVILEDGSAGAFYTSLDDTLEQLKKRYPEGETVKQDCLSLIKKITSNKHHERAIALGAINAASQHVMKLAGFSPVDADALAKSGKASSTGISQAKKGERIGMIGYFGPLIERLLEKGIEVLVLEKNPARVEPQAGVIVSENVKDLSTCQHILCTASTLINNTLDEVLQHSKQAKSFSLIGPSGSSLPDILFKHGVNAVGGFHFSDIPALKQALKNQESWGHTGSKYQLTPENYPGIEVLLERIVQNSR